MVPEESVAEVCHELMAVRCRQTGDRLTPWAELPPWRRQLWTDMVSLVRRGMPASDAHSLWAAALTGAGWTDGPWDERARSCPWLGPWDLLPPHGRSLFRLFRTVTIALSVELIDQEHVAVA